MPAASIRAQPRHPVGLAAALELVAAAGAPRGRSRRSPCRSARARSRARRSTHTSRARPARTGAPSASRAGSRRRRGSRPSCGRSGGVPSSRSRSSTHTDARGLRRISSRATARPMIPPPTIARSQRSGGCVARAADGAEAVDRHRCAASTAIARARRGRSPPRRSPARRRTGASSPPPPSLRAVARRRAVICAGVGWRPSTPLAMISAAVAATWGVGHRGAFVARRHAEAARTEPPVNVTWKTSRPAGCSGWQLGSPGRSASAPPPGRHERQPGAVVGVVGQAAVFGGGADGDHVRARAPGRRSRVWPSLPAAATTSTPWRWA